MSENLIIFNRTQRLSYLRNRELSWKAKGIYTYLTSHDGTWKIQHNDLYSRSEDGKNGTQSGLMELREAKLIYRTRIREQNGRFEWGYAVYSVPTEIGDAIEDLKKDFQEADFTSALFCGTGQQGTGKTITNNKVKVIIINKRFDKIDSSKDELALAKKQPTHVYRKLLRRPKKINREEISNSLKVQQEKLPLKEPKIMPPKIQEILNYHSLLLHKYKPDSKAYIESSKVIGKLLRGTFFKDMNGRYAKYDGKKFSIDEIKWTLDRIKQAGHPDYYPKIKRSLKAPFNLLVYNPRTTNKEFESNFLHYFENEPQHYGNGVSLADDPDKDLTDTFRYYYRDKVLSGNKQSFNNVEENHFRKGTQQAQKFFNFNRSRLLVQSKSTYVNSLKEAFGALDKTRFYPSTFSSDDIWERHIPTYLKKYGYMNPEEGEN